MTSIYQQFRTNPEIEQNGVTIDYGDFKFMIARAGGANRRYEQALEKKARPFRRALANDLLPNSRQREILMEVFAETVVLGWEGIRGEDGEEISHSPAACLQLFKDLPDIFDDIKEQAERAALFRVSTRETQAKN